MISVSIHTNKMQEVIDWKYNDKLERMIARGRYMTPYDFKSEIGYYQRPKDEMIEIAMNIWNENIRNGLKCSFRVYEIISFSPYESRLLYEHW